MKQRRHKDAFFLGIVVTALFCTGSGGNLFAESPIQGSLQTHLGVFYGGMNEYVYKTGEDHELSRLEWEERFVPYLTAIGQLEVWNFFLQLSILTVIPVKSGFMRDFDYMLNNNTTLTHFSKHDALFEKHLEISPKIGYRFPVGRFSFSPAAGILYQNRKWTAVDGYAQYPPNDTTPWSPDIPKQEMYGSIISYEATIWFPTVSLESTFSINERFILGLNMGWYPYISIKTIDSHYLRTIQYHDTMQGSMGGMAEIFLTYTPAKSKGISFMGAFGYEGLFPYRGSTAEGKLGPGAGVKDDLRSQSKMESNLFWFSTGIIIRPRELW